MKGIGIPRYTLLEAELLLKQRTSLRCRKAKSCLERGGEPLFKIRLTFGVVEVCFV